MQPARGLFFDGQTAAQHDVAVALSDDRLALIIEGATIAAPLRWNLSDLRATGDHAQAGELILTCHAETNDESPRDPARLILNDPVAVAWLNRTRPNLHKADLRKGTGVKIAKRAGFAVGAVALLLFVILPAMANTLAKIIPLEREIGFGKSVVAQMERFLGNGGELGNLNCTGEEGRAALDAMTARLSEGRDLGYELNVIVFDHDMVNAFAAPGGQIVLLRGLIEDVSGPDAVAAVLAHEIAHVVNRDPTRVSLRAVGSAGLISLLIGDVTGGVVMTSVAEQLLSASYTREAEKAADDFAIAMLNDAGISSAGMADFFDMVTELQGDFQIPEYFATHPQSQNRASLARENAAAQDDVTPALSEDDWTALKAICS